MFYAFNITNGEVFGYTTENTRFAELTLYDPELCPISDTCAYEIMARWLEANGHDRNISKFGLEADYYAMYRYHMLTDAHPRAPILSGPFSCALLLCQPKYYGSNPSFKLPENMG